MRYWDFWWQNQHWPPKLPDAKGRHVRLAQEIRTRNGGVFDEGELLRIVYGRAGRLGLKRVAGGGFLVGICPTRVHLLAADFEPTIAEKRGY